MADTEKTAATLLAELAALDPPQRREVAKELRKVAENFAGVPDGRNTRPHAAAAGPHARSVLMGVVGEIAPLGLENYGSQALQWRTTPLVIIAFDFRRGLRIRYVEPRPVLAAVPVVDDYSDL